ncbi:MAG: glycosyltransferase family 39 protein [Candidatus Eisenbacteria bacterium]|nr:glycosyltransferase family 39 protein [Candidatus Eisenbacteria bacterium]
MHPSRDRARTALLVGLILSVAAALRCWNLAAHGFDNLYYSPAALSMASDWHHFFFAAFDRAGFLAIGKPPVAFWMQALSVRLCGFNGLAIHLPQAFAGVLSVLIVFRLARRVTGVPGAALAALIAAVTPASVAADRSNLADSWLLLVLLGAASLTLSASDTGSARRLALGSALVGVGFLTKFMVAYLSIPALFLTYGLTAPIALRRRLTHLGLAAVVVTLTSLVWPVAVDLTPRDRRPYIAETNDDSMLSLAFGFQGLGRVVNRAAPAMSNDGPASGSRSGGPAPGPDAAGSGPASGHAGFPGRPGPGSPGGSGPSPRVITGHGGAPGPFRLANRDMAGHITWFLPVVLVGMIATIRRKPVDRTWRRSHRDAFFWIVWFLTFAAVFSLPPTFIHPYYLTLLAPAVAVLTVVAAGGLWASLEHGGRSVLLPAAAVALTLLWHAGILGFHPSWARPLVPVLGVAGFASVAGLLIARTPLIRKSALCLGSAATFVCPLLWAATPALAPVGRMVPIADPALLDYRKTAAAAGARPTQLPTLVRFLQANRRGERFMLAVRDIHRAAPVILEAGEAVMAFGGYYGREETLDVGGFARMVSAGAVRYVLLAAAGDTGQMAGPSPRSPSRNGIEEWVRNHGTLVPVEAWQSPDVGTAGASAPMPMWGPTDQMVSMMYGDSALELYDCRTARATSHPNGSALP